MNNRPIIHRAMLGFLLLSGLSASAQVTFWGVQKGESYTQTADNTAPTDASYNVFVFADTTNVTDANSITVSDNDSIIMTNPPESPTTSFGVSSFYATKAQMDAAFTSGDNYTFAVSGGNLGGQTDSIPIPEDFYPSQVYLGGTTWSDAQHIDPGADFGLNLAYSDIGTGTNVDPAYSYTTSTSFAIFDPVSNSFIYNVYGDAGASSFTIDEAFLQTLVPGQIYTGQVTQYDVADIASGGDFSGAPNSDGFAQFLDFNFVVVPEPSGWAWGLIVCGLLAAARLRRLARC